MNGKKEGFSIAPVKVGEELEVEIEAVGEKGDGIAKKNGFVLFVPNTKEGETVKIRVTKVLRKVGFAEVIERIEEREAKVEKEEKVIEDTENFGEEVPEPPVEEKTYSEEVSDELKEE